MKKYLVSFNKEVLAESDDQAKDIIFKEMVVRETLPYLESPLKVFDQMREERKSKKEHFVVFHLDTQHNILSKNIVSIGTLNASLIHPRETFRPAIYENCANIIIAHNHPSGSLEPSVEDLSITKRLQDAGKILGIEVLDHVIVTEFGYVSLKEKLLM